MYRIYIETAGAGIGYYSDIDLKPFFERTKFLEVPGIRVFDDIPADCNNIVTYINNSENRFLCNDHEMLISYDKNRITDSSIVRIGLVLLEKVLSENNKIIVHSACVSKDDEAIYFLGRSGTGKTSVVLDLCLNKGFRLVGNDRIIIGMDDDGKLCSYEGTKFINLRYSSIFYNCPQLLYLFDRSDIDPWLNKKCVDARDINIELESRKLQIVKTYLLHIDDRQKKLYNNIANEDLGDKLRNSLFLNEFFQMGIRGMYSTFLNKDFEFSGYLPSFDRREFYDNRVRMMDYIMNKTDFEYVSGNLEKVSEYVSDNQKKRKRGKKNV